MALFNFGKQEIKKLSEQVKALQSTNLQTLTKFSAANDINRLVALYPNFDITKQTERYVGTDDIYSIIRLLSTTAALVPLYGYLQKPDQKSFRQLTREKKGYNNPYRYKSLQVKALEDLPDDDPVANLLEHPSEIMSKYEFFEAVHTLLCLYGECFILKERPDDGVNAGMPIQLHLLFPQNVIIKVSVSLPRKIVAYDYRVNGVTIHENISAEDVIHVKYFNPELSLMGNELRGLSPLKVLRKRLTRLDSNMDISVAQLQNGGVETIVYDKDTSASAADIIGKRKSAYYKFASDSNNAGMPYFASGEMGVLQLGSHLSDLGVAELAGVDFDKLCNAFGVSNILFNNNSSSTESNVQIMTKRLYTNTVLPNVYRVRDGLIKGLLPDFKNGILIENADGNITKIKGDGKNRYIDADITDISELHQDLEKKAASLATMYWLTPNEKREMMNYDRYDDPLFDEPLIPTGLVTLQEMETIPPIDITTPNGN